MDLQPTLQDEWVKIEPLELADKEYLFAVAADPLIWEQHPNPDRYRRDAFELYFAGAIESRGAFLVCIPTTGEIVGCTRYYEFRPEEKDVIIGYTFLARAHWGGKINRSLKKLMLDHAFRYVEKVRFHVGANNRRSQIAVERLGAVKVREFDVTPFGEPPKRNFEYELSKMRWANHWVS